MLLIRPTKSLAKKLKVTPVTAGPTSPILNEWYCNDFKFGRTDLAIFVNPATFLPLVLKAAPYRTLVDRFREELPSYLKRLGHSNPPLDLGGEVQFLKTNERSTIGIMVDFVKMLQFEDGYGRYGPQGPIGDDRLHQPDPDHREEGKISDRHVGGVTWDGN